ncbi:hypothetical protein [Pedobacter gandavensis]|uniref:Uncharacterized protein n=1 Tax=Pedobacter gandavensis TaxID=2679963 RepID=A0ABR6EU43_9SPHI|nr:hypothetical protein [Pedobacter gandavensis]MBB2148790.1 hypothetical protein [Pedobacter gandavensis]
MEEIKEGYYEFNMEILDYWKSKGVRSITCELIETDIPYEYLEENAVLITPSFDEPYSRPITEEFPFDDSIPDKEDVNSDYVLRLTTPIDLVINVVKEEYIRELL